MGDQDAALHRDALRRAYAIARAFQAEFFLLRVMPGPSPQDVLLPHVSLLQAMSGLARAQRVLDATLAQGEEFAPGLTAAQILIRQGNHLHEVARAALELRVDLVVTPRQRGLTGRSVAWLAHRTCAPVLVAGPAARNESIVAATDMLDVRYPVLRRAAEWSSRLEAPLVCVHNTEEPPANTTSWTRITIDLLQAALRFGRDVESIVVRHRDPVEAILSEARIREADLVVVGVRPPSWFDVFASGGLASRLVDRAQRSVLVTPIAEVG